MRNIFLHSNTKRKRKNLFSVLAEGRARSNGLNWQQGLMYRAGDAVGLGMPGDVVEVFGNWLDKQLPGVSSASCPGQAEKQDDLL